MAFVRFREVRDKAAFPLSPARPNDRRPRQANAMQATIPTDAQIIRNGIAAGLLDAPLR
ncbi:hypothetical protein [Paracoccus actinidiae]|uniref:hypothetical protein n=1 Tax=Paracoccus actinidiae TaxID=3064531 RepID=UPI0027D3457F|nr:hypothetical protein [Paracoccus sp. M09]